MSSIRRTRQELIADFLKLDQGYGALVGSCSSEQLTWQAEGAWSISECIEHVGLANSQYLPLMRTAIEKNRSLPGVPVDPLSTGGWFSSYFVSNVVGPEVKNRYKAPKKIRPSPGDVEQALHRLLATHSEIRELLASKSQPDLNKIRFENPFVSVIRFTVATGLLIMAAHGRRHLRQAERVREAEGFPR